MNKKIIIPALCITALIALPGCYKKKQEKPKTENIRKANKRSKEIIEDNIS